MDGICDDVDDCVGELTLAACATALARFTNADVQTFLKATVTARNQLDALGACGGDWLRRRC